MINIILHYILYVLTVECCFVRNLATNLLIGYERIFYVKKTLRLLNTGQFFRQKLPI
jgi:hypothetical protein